MQATATNELELFGSPSEPRRRFMSSALLVLVIAVLAAAINPAGYLGGAADDYYYLMAAECWAEKGACLPVDHWSARWPLIAPIGASIALLGESRASVSLAPFLYAVAALLLVNHIASKLFGRTAGLAAAALLAFTPVFTTRILALNVDIVELTFLLAALAAWLRSISRQDRYAAFAGGVALALAVQSRETSLAYAAVFGLWFILMNPPHRRVTIWALPGFALPTLLQMLVTWIAAGDPFLRIRLALAHTRIPSTELSVHVDTSSSPLFNPAYIAGWRPAAGIDVHWTINPILNLFASAELGLTLILPVLMFLIFRRNMTFDGLHLRRAALLTGAAAAGALLLIYGLAIDPKPRMFLPLAAASAIGAGALGAMAWKAGKRRLVVILGLLGVVMGLPVTFSALNTRPAEPVAAAWIRETGSSTTVDESARRILALVPAVRALPVDDPSRPLQLEFGETGCSAAKTAERSELRSFPLARRDPNGPALCLFRRLSPKGSE